MTNAEKYKEVFGLEPDIDVCPTFLCSRCPLENKCEGNKDIWWLSEYKENKE